MGPGLTERGNPSTWRFLLAAIPLRQLLQDFCPPPTKIRDFSAPVSFLLQGTDSAHVFPITTKKSPGTNPKLPGKKETNPTRSWKRAQIPSQPLFPQSFSVLQLLWGVQPWVLFPQGFPVLQLLLHPSPGFDSLWVFLSCSSIPAPPGSPPALSPPEFILALIRKSHFLLG